MLFSTLALQSGFGTTDMPGALETNLYRIMEPTGKRVAGAAPLG
jgi:hypothetical protein